MVHDNRVALFLMDYLRRKRLKIMARGETPDAKQRPGLIKRLEDADNRAKIQWAVIYEVETFDRTCPQHITPR